MAKVKILIEGYVSGKDNDNSCCTVTLIQDEDGQGNKINMVVDPGTLKDRQILIDALKKENLSIEDINYVCITHSHMDHYRNLGMFPQAKALDYYGVWENDTVKEWKSQFAKNTKIIKTPGHNYDGLSLLVKTERGMVAVVGDVFWKKDFPPVEEDIYASDKEKLIKSRKLVLDKADFIVPGHGNIYEV